MDNKFVIEENEVFTEFEITIEKFAKLPSLYIALLEYCQELTGDSIKSIDEHMTETVLEAEFDTGDKLNG